ncbi:hypothetical protein AVEN_117131-1 [Araneus ventricosus]|uniref:Uncharacterized protein n=1 Tax=Araneus ventricosus TaxID=182803 RepID=A0A4Y2VMK1_ARAVE|nr:hypothetical protein AVEN_117131-1 [Araneus ventricosus]
MYLLQTLVVLCLLSTNLLAAVQKAEKKLWQEVPQASQDAKLDAGFASGVDYSNRDMGGYSAGSDYQNGGIGNYGNNYDGNMNGNGYGGDVHGGGGYNGVSYSESYSGPSESYSGAQEGFSSPGDGYSGHSDSFSGGHGEGFGGDLRNGGWEKPVKTVVKHTYKNIAVPHHVPAPVSVPVPRYVKYFKPFAIEVEGYNQTTTNNANENSKALKQLIKRKGKSSSDY